MSALKNTKLMQVVTLFNIGRLSHKRTAKSIKTIIIPIIGFTHRNYKIHCSDKLYQNNLHDETEKVYRNICFAIYDVQNHLIFQLLLNHMKYKAIDIIIYSLFNNVITSLNYSLFKLSSRKTD